MEYPKVNPEPEDPEPEDPEPEDLNKMDRRLYLRIL